MNKLLVIDNRLAEWVHDKYDKVEFARFPDDYFDWDEEGNYCRPRFEKKEFDFVMMHHSQLSPKPLPSNFTELLSLELENKLIFFSGGITKEELTLENPELPYSIALRDSIERGFRNFARKSIRANQWLIGLFFESYIPSLIRSIQEMMDRGIDVSVVKQSSPLNELLLLKNVFAGTDLYEKIMRLNDRNLMEELKKL